MITTLYDPTKDILKKDTIPGRWGRRGETGREQFGKMTS
jgi:hypothetical protein